MIKVPVAKGFKSTRMMKVPLPKMPKALMEKEIKEEDAAEGIIPPLEDAPPPLVPSPSEMPPDLPPAVPDVKPPVSVPSPVSPIKEE